MASLRFSEKLALWRRYEAACRGLHIANEKNTGEAEQARWMDNAMWSYHEREAIVDGLEQRLAAQQRENDGATATVGLTWGAF